MIRPFMMIGLLLIFMVPQAWGYANPNRQTMWNNLTDSIHTIGQTPQQASLTKRKLHHARSLARIKSINQAKQQAWMQGSN